MFDRRELKQKAKYVLANTYWYSLAVCLIVSAITEGVSLTFIYGFMGGAGFYELTQNPQSVTLYPPAYIIMFFAVMLLLLSFAVFLFSPLTAGKYRYFIKSAQSEASIGTVFEVFRSEHYLNVVRVLLMRDLKLLAWSLLYIVPMTVLTVLSSYLSMPYLPVIGIFGIIPLLMKTYSYYMVNYIVGENPDISWREALKESEMMMKCCRFGTFILELSFIGWIYLGMLACGMGTVFVTPYIDAATTQLYLNRKSHYENEKSNGLI